MGDVIKVMSSLLAYFKLKKKKILLHQYLTRIGIFYKENCYDTNGHVARHKVLLQTYCFKLISKELRQTYAIHIVYNANENTRFI